MIGKGKSLEYSSLNEFLTKWNKAERKTAIIEELTDHGILLSELKNKVGKDYDEFDLICHVAFDKKPLTRKERARNARKLNYFDKYGEQARDVIDALITKYEDEGIENIEDLRILKVNPFNKFGTPFEIMKYFGGKINYLKAIRKIEKAIYSS